MAASLSSARSQLVGLGLFGSFDGLMTALGVILGAANASRQLLLAVSLCVSTTGALSMAAGAVLEDDDSGWREALVMGVATLLGTFVPAVPVLTMARPGAYFVTAALAVALAGGIARLRGGRRRDYLISYGMLFGVAIPTVGIAMAFGSAG